MSGGSWDYLCYKVQDAAERLGEERSVHRRALGKHLLLVAEALHDIEWVDSSDRAKGSELPAIMKVLGPSGDEEALKLLKQDAEALIEELRRLIGHEPQI